MRSKKKLKNLTKLKLKNSTRVLLVVLSLVAFSISSSNIFKSIFQHDFTNVEKNVYTYTNTYNMDYTVKIKDNSFYDESYLPSNQTYVSDLVDSIDMSIKYNYSASKESIVKYNYKIDAIIVGNYDDNGSIYSIWNKEYNLKNVDSLQSDNGNITIDENINIDYKKYNQEVKNFKQTLGMSLDAYLYVKLTVNTITTIKNEEIPNEYVSNFSISLGEKIAMVDGKNNDKKVDSIKHSKTIVDKDVDVLSIVFNSAIMILSIYAIYFIRFKTKKFNAIKNEFRFELNRILKSCQDRVVVVKSRTNLDGSVVDVNDFGELIKLSEELYKPILCWISDDLNDEEAWFSIISNNIRYRYVLKK